MSFEHWRLHSSNVLAYLFLAWIFKALCFKTVMFRRFLNVTIAIAMSYFMNKVYDGKFAPEFNIPVLKEISTLV